jgi:PAS domain S-box-containing protein
MVLQKSVFDPKRTSGQGRVRPKADDIAIRLSFGSPGSSGRGLRQIYSGMAQNGPSEWLFGAGDKGESDARYRLLVESLAQAVWETDADGVVVADSPSWRAYTGQTLDEWLGYGWLNAIHPDDRAYAERQWREAMAARRAVDAEYRLRAPDGGWRWTNVRAAPVFDADAHIEKWAGINIDIDGRKRAEAELRESEERQAYFLALSDALRPLADQEEIQAEAMRLLGEKIGVNRAQYYVADETGEYLSSSGGYSNGIPAAIGRFHLIEFGKYAFDGFHAGETQVVSDARTDPRITEEVLRSYETVGFMAYIGVPFVQRGRLVGTLAVHQSNPRQWTVSERMMVEETAERAGIAVEQARAESALRQSQERFQQFANASAAGMWIRDAETLSMEYVSPAIARIYGVEPDAFIGEMRRWAAMILPEDREVALGHIEAARRGEAVVHEFRIQRPDDQTFRWIRNTELQHRVRNIMAITRSIAARTGERAGRVTEYAEVLSGRLLALSRVQTLLTRAANVSVGLRSIVVEEISVQAQHEGQYEIEGPEIAISPKAAEVMTLALHELSTNALKYGALSVPDGKVAVRWEIIEKRETPWLSLNWTEQGAPERQDPQPDKPRRQGFGSELIEGRIPYELKGRGKLAIGAGGAECHLEFPLKAGPSILETGAPQRATVFGGALDMTGEPDLGGLRILVVEDDYYLATDAARALRGAGAEVLGPYPTEDEARDELAAQRPDAVLLDINLGPGPTFKLAEHLKDNGIPFVFVTGYDQNVIPAEFDNIERLEKPLQLRQLVGAVSKLVTAPS